MKIEAGRCIFWRRLGIRSAGGFGSGGLGAFVPLSLEQAVEQGVPGLGLKGAWTTVVVSYMLIPLCVPARPSRPSTGTWLA